MNSPVSVAAPGNSVTGALASDLTFNTMYPFAKLDSQNPVSFQNISIVFGVDPPNPDGTILTTLSTTVYKFPHGYNYVPATWLMWQRTTGSALQDGETANRYPGYGYEGGIIAAYSSADITGNAQLNIEVDATNIYIQVTKNFSSIDDGSVNLVGYVLLIRVYAFVNDLSGTDVTSAQSMPIVPNP